MISELIGICIVRKRHNYFFRELQHGPQDFIEVKVYHLEQMIEPPLHNKVPPVMAQCHEEHYHLLLNVYAMVIL